MKNKTLFYLALVMTLIMFVVSAIAQAEVLTENFSNASLDIPPWQVISGQGNYSLTANPGYLRYNLEGPQSRPDGWRTGITNTWNPSLNLILPFDGDYWTLNTKITYNLHACSGSSCSFDSNTGSNGAQGTGFYIAFGNDDFLDFGRGVDWWGSTKTNLHQANLTSGNTVIESSGSMLAADDTLNIEGGGNGAWARYSYWYEIERNGQEITFLYSNDGVNYTTGLTASMTTPIGSTQKFILGANVWTTAGSYADLDYVNVNVVPEPISSILFVTGGALLAGRRFIRMKA